MDVDKEAVAHVANGARGGRNRGRRARRCRPRERELIQWKHHFEHLFNCVNHREQTLPTSPELKVLHLITGTGRGGGYDPHLGCQEETETVALQL